MEDNLSPSLGMSRRDLLRRGAIVGGTLMWATPAVQSIARPAFGQDNGTPRDCHAISYLAVVITNDQTYQFKIEANGTIEHFGNVPHCPNPPGWQERQQDGDNIGGMPPGTTYDISDECCWSITLPPGYSLVGVAMGAGGEQTDQGFCVNNPQITNGGQRYVFCAPAK